MRNKRRFAIAVRLPDGSIKVKKEKSSRFSKLFEKFFIRGIVGLGYTIYDGIKALSWSSNQQLEKEEKLTKKELSFAILTSFIFALFLFVALPFLSAHLLGGEGIFFDVIDGVVRIGVFLTYLGVVSLMKDVKTLFSYHGAEHKTIYCYEKSLPLTVENVKKQSRFHPRCGTSFIFIVLLLSIIIFSLINGPLWMKFLGRIIFLPVIAGLGYELIKLSGKYRQDKIVKILIAPGLWLQRITTKEPNDKQIEVGIASLRAVVE